MQAYKCDKCDNFIPGAPEMKVKTNKLIFAINYSPDSENANWYIHDLCPQCSEAFRVWWRANR